MFKMRLYAFSLVGLLASSLTTKAQFTDNKTDFYFEISKNLEIHANIFKELNTFYVDPIEPGKMIKTGVDAMLSELDPYTVFITEADVEDFQFQATGKYGGIGAAIRMNEQEEIVIAEPYENGPVHKAGLKSGDIILSIDGLPLKGRNGEDVGLLMRGSPGTEIKMEIKHPFTGAIKNVSFKREEIRLSSVPYANLIGSNRDIAYVFLAQFIQNCSRDVRMALDSLKKIQPDLKGVVLDLRGNPGGLLDEAVNVANLFIDKGQLIVSTKGKNKDWDAEFNTRNLPWDLNIPLAVMINNSSASSSEIVAGTIQDLDRGIVLGQRSFGKGLVQSVRPLGYNTNLKVTTAKYYTPSGRCIQALDYSQRNHDGSVASVPDSLKKEFKTSKGRKVYDGGGIEPDLPGRDYVLSKLAISLLSKGFVFDYATYYQYHNPQAPPIEDLKFTEKDFNEFVEWLGDKDYSYKTDSELILKKLKIVAEQERYFDNIKSEFEALEAKLYHDKKQDLLKHKEEVIQLVSNEIAGRYYFQMGRVINKLSNDDPDLDEAIRALQNINTYKSILSKK